MYLEQASTLVDQLIYEFNGEHLNDLERSIVQGVCEGKKYGEIAEELECTTGHVTDTAAKLWQSL
jgi:DNA-directed RNA polymerase specialized sigma24 family protein